MNLMTHADQVGGSLSEIFANRIRSGFWGLKEAIPTEEELVQEFGVSRSTVRRAMKDLEDTGCIESVRGRGRRVLKEPEAKSKTIGFLATNDMIHQWGGGRLFRAVQSSLAKHGANVVTFALNPSQPLSETGSVLNFSKVPGLIAMAHHYRLHELEKLARQVPMVTINQNVHQIKIPSFFMDYGAHALMATAKLLQAGHRKIAFAYRRKSYIDYVGSDIQRGYEWALFSQGLALDQRIVFRQDSTEESGAEIYRKLITEEPDVTALVTYSHVTAKGMWTAAREMGHDLPRRLTTVCLTDVDEKNPDLEQAISYFECPIEQMVDDAIAELFKIMQGQVSENHRSYYGAFHESPAGLRSSLTA